MISYQSWCRGLLALCSLEVSEVAQLKENSAMNYSPSGHLTGLGQSFNFATKMKIQEVRELSDSDFPGLVTPLFDVVYSFLCAMVLNLFISFSCVTDFHTNTPDVSVLDLVCHFFSPP